MIYSFDNADLVSVLNLLDDQQRCAVVAAKAKGIEVPEGDLICISFNGTTPLTPAFIERMKGMPYPVRGYINRFGMLCLNLAIDEDCDISSDLLKEQDRHYVESSNPNCYFYPFPFYMQSEDGKKEFLPNLADMRLITDEMKEEYGLVEVKDFAELAQFWNEIVLA